MPEHHRSTAIAIAAALACSSATASEGSRLVGQGPTQLATAGAGAASPLDSTWLSLNAAGLTAVGHRADLSAETIYAEVELEPRGLFANPDAGRMEEDVVVVAPHLFYARPLSEEATVGVGLYTVSGLHVEWDEPRSVFGTADDFDTESTLTTTRASLGYARRVGPDTSLGIAFNLNYAELNSDIVTAAGTETDGGNDVDRSLGAGFQLALHHRVEAWSVALVYTSRQWMQSFEDYDDVLIGPLDMPPVTQLGVAWQASDRLELLWDVRHIDWGSVEAIGDETRGFGWESQIVVKLAARYRVGERLLLMGGVSYGASQIDEEDAFLNGLSVLTNEWHLTAGATWDASDRFQVQASLLHAPANEVRDDGGTFGAATAGTEIAIAVTSLGLGVGYRF